MTLIIASSPRRGKNSDGIARIISSCKKDSTVIFARDYKISPCIACEYCHKNGNGKCAINDDMEKIRALMTEADEIIISSPIYWWSITAQLKLIIDRVYAFSDKLEGKKLKVILNAMADENDVEYSLLDSQFREMSAYIKMDYSFMHISCPEDDSYLKKSEEIKRFALS